MVWDYLTDVCGAVGHIVFVEDSFLTTGDAVPTIVIQRPLTLYGIPPSGGIWYAKLTRQ